MSLFVRWKDRLLAVSEDMSQDEKKNVISLDISKRITSLRFLLILFVIFIHANLTASDAINYYHYDFNQPKWVEIIKTIVCEILGSAAVPLFFLFASYLQFSKNDNYPVLIKKKSKTLLVPYLLWTLITILLYSFTQSIPVLSRFFQNPNNIIRNWTFIDWINAFTYQKVDNSGRYPLVFQFWFLRDLMILIILTPFWKFLMEKIPGSLIIIISILAVKNIPIFLIDRSSSLFFFLIGYYFAKYKLSFFEIADKIKIWEYFILYFFYCLFEFCFQGSYNFEFIGTLISCLFFLKVSYYFIRVPKLYSILEFLAQYSFFIYAVHMPFIGTVINKITQRIIPLHGIFCLIQFILASFLTLLIAMIIAFLIRKIIPKLFSLLSGGR